jgi:hypothetical protein
MACNIFVKNPFSVKIRLCFYAKENPFPTLVIGFFAAIFL